jgi:hypothetical protein
MKSPPSDDVLSGSLLVFLFGWGGRLVAVLDFSFNHFLERLVILVGVLFRFPCRRHTLDQVLGLVEKERIDFVQGDEIDNIHRVGGLHINTSEIFILNENELGRFEKILAIDDTHLF